MLKLVVPGTEMWDEDKSEFLYTEDTVLFLEHSLVSISKWESKYCKPFMTEEEKSMAELIDYIKFMTTNEIDDENVYSTIINNRELVKTIYEYMNAPMTATWFSKENKKTRSREVITSEVIYYWMTALNIPFSCETWHINRLITLIRVCSEEQKPQKDLKLNDLYKRNSALNAARMKRAAGKHG